MVLAMFEGITEGLGKALSSIGRAGKITEGNIRDAMKEIRSALLEADVGYDIANDFVKTVTEQAVGERVLKSLRPSEQIVGIVHQELINLMGWRSGQLAATQTRWPHRTHDVRFAGKRKNHHLR